MTESEHSFSWEVFLAIPNNKSCNHEIVFAALSTCLQFSILFAGMTTGMALLPSYSLLSEMSIIRFRIWASSGCFSQSQSIHVGFNIHRLRGSLGSLNTLNANGGYLWVIYLIYLNYQLRQDLLPFSMHQYWSTTHFLNFCSGLMPYVHSFLTFSNADLL